MTNTTNSQTLVYNLTERDDIRRLYVAVSPNVKTARACSPSVLDYQLQVDSICEQLQTLLESTNLVHGIVNMFVFMADTSMKQLVRNAFVKLTGSSIGDCEYMPVTTFVPQPPADGSLVAVELYAVGGSSVLIANRCYGVSLELYYHDTMWLYTGDVLSNAMPVGAYRRTVAAFDEIENYLEMQDAEPEDLVRTWLFQGNLTYEEDGIQRYMELNRGRSDYFSTREKFLQSHLPRNHKGAVYPASTGIGTNGFDLVVSAVAFSSKRRSIIVVPIENPDQTPAFDYTSEYSPKSPKFSRAMAIAYDGMCKIYISGTASITESTSRFPDDPVAQTNQTLDNITRLIAGDNLQKSGIKGFAPTLNNGKSYRVYIKKPEHYEAIRKVCEARLPEVPVVYTIADICRPELLVEIEGVVDM
jgi:enamine deaminase RidA (YjgF/YER057c/UK114 family)